MSLMNLATVFGPSLLRPPVVGVGHDGIPVDISQEVALQVRFIFSSDREIYWINNARTVFNSAAGAGGVLVPAVPRPS